MIAEKNEIHVLQPNFRLVGETREKLNRIARWLTERDGRPRNEADALEEVVRVYWEREGEN